VRRSGRGVNTSFEEVVDQGQPIAVPNLPPEAGASPAHRQVAKARLFLNNRPLIWRFLWIGTVLTIILALIWPKKYEASTRLMPPDSSSSSMSAAALMSRVDGAGESSSGGGGGSGILGMYAASLLGMKSSGGLFIGILHSSTVQDRIIDKFDLRKVYHVRQYEDARRKLGNYTTVLEDKKSGIINISVVDGSPQRAAAIARAYVDELDRLVAQLSTSSARRERIFLEERLKTVKQDLDAATQQLGQFSSNSSTLDPKEQGKAMVQGAAELEGDLIAAESQLSGLQQIYTENNVRVRSLEARIQELKAQLQKLQGTPTLNGQDSNAYPSLRQLPLLAVTYSDLYRRAQIEETVFQVLTKQYELAKVQEAKEIPTVRVLDQAQVPERRMSPKRTQWVLIGATLSLLAGMAFVALRERWQGISIEDPRKALTLELIDGAKMRMKAFEAQARSSRFFPFHRDNLN
jgi:uncharacterized protein involved in exopolysaccharide biosynthesis